MEFLILYFFFFLEMLGLQGISSAHIRQDGASRHPSDKIGDCPAAALRLEQIHDNNGIGVVNCRQIAGGTGGNAKLDGQSLQDCGGSSHLLRGEAALLSGRLVSADTGDEEYDKKFVQFIYLSFFFG